MDGHDTTGLVSEPPQDELWLISYADLLTLLLGFFVLLLAATDLKPSRFERIAAAITGDAPPLEDLRGKVEALIQREDLAGRVVAREDAEGLGIEFRDAFLFDSGSADLRTEARRLVAEVAALVRELPDRPVVIEGHTDEVPIRTDRFGSNWELSAQRAINVLHALAAEGVPPARMSARGYADTRPVRPASPVPVEDLRRMSRRVIIRVE